MGLAINIGINKARQAKIKSEQPAVREVAPTPPKPVPVIEKPSTFHVAPAPVSKPATEKLPPELAPNPAPESETGKLPPEFTNSIGMKFVLIKAGTFWMGSPDNERGRNSDETKHKVTLTKDFYFQTTEVTQAQYEEIMASNPSDFKGDNLPVEQVTWNDAVEFCKKLSVKEGKAYRLPTEAEWEHACRAGTITSYSFRDNEGKLEEYACYGNNSGNKTHPVGKKMPNAWGVYDMHGNVWEWCSDWYGGYQGGSVTDPKGPENGNTKVVRGGSWGCDPGLIRSAGRNGDGPDLSGGDCGFRCVMSP